jgi:hypothetical protein
MRLTNSASLALVSAGNGALPVSAAALSCVGTSLPLSRWRRTMRWEAVDERRLAAEAAGKPISRRRGRDVGTHECLLQVSDEVIHILDARGDAH